MAKQSNWSKSGGYFINDKIGGENVPVEGTEPLRSFADGTGKRKYDKDDPSVGEMRKRRARTYSSPMVGMPWGTFKDSKKTVRKLNPRSTRSKKQVPVETEAKVLTNGVKIMIINRRKGIMRGFR